MPRKTYPDPVSFTKKLTWSDSYPSSANRAKFLGTENNLKLRVIVTLFLTSKPECDCEYMGILVQENLHGIVQIILLKLSLIIYEITFLSYTMK